MKKPTRAKKTRQRSPEATRAPRVGRARQRQHLIDACISALHRHGPSKTTVEKVVAIANLSPGIVRFYFDSKDAMLVASLEFLANEFAEQLVLPITALRADPVAALDRLVDLYLGPQLASPRKVSVWYSFWGEATSRQEYYEICGARDAQFEALVRDIVGDLVAREGADHLDTDGVTLGLIGSLEMIWQGYAFQTETAIDRAAARRPIDAYLRSVFPRAFGRRAANEQTTLPGSVQGTSPLPAGWTYACRTEELETPGSALAVDTLWGPILVIRTSDDSLQAVWNRCPRRPHALVTGTGIRHLERLGCAVHGVSCNLNGRALEPAGTSLQAAAHCVTGTLVWVGPAVRMPAPTGAALTAATQLLGETTHRRARPLRAAWTTVVEHWLEQATNLSDNGGEVDPWRGETWTARSFRAIARTCGTPHVATYVAPGQLVESGPAGVHVHSIVADGADRSHWITTHHPARHDARSVRALTYLMRRRIRMECALAESIQANLAAGIESRPVAVLAAIDRFRRARADLHSTPVDTTGVSP